MAAAAKNGKPKLSIATIADAAIGLADHQGLNAVSMRSTAKALGVQAMSLYNHVANKDDLLDHMVDAVVGQIALPAGDVGWQEFLRQRCHAAYGVLKTHPWVGTLLVSRMNTGQNMLSYVNATIGALVRAGFSYPQADHIWNAVDNHLYGYVLQEQHFPIERDNYASVAREYLPQLEKMGLPHLEQMTRLVAEGHYNGLHDIDFGLNLIINGIEKQLQPKK